MNATFTWITRMLIVTGIALSGTGTALAQPYSSKPVRIVTAAPGGGVDFTARLLALGLTANLGQQFVVDNRGGTHVSAHMAAHAANVRHHRLGDAARQIGAAARAGRHQRRADGARTGPADYRRHGAGL